MVKNDLINTPLQGVLIKYLYQKSLPLSANTSTSLKHQVLGISIVMLLL